MTYEGTMPASKGAAPLIKPSSASVHRRIAEACLRLERRTTEAKRNQVLALFDQAAKDCANSVRAQSVRDCYRQLEWTVVSEFYDRSHLPSETTFRRAVKRERHQLAGVSKTLRSLTAKEFEAYLSAAIVKAYETMPSAGRPAADG